MIDFRDARTLNIKFEYMIKIKRHYVLFRTAGLGNQLYYCAYCDHLLSKGYSKVSLLNIGAKQTGDTQDKNKRNLILEIPFNLSLKRRHLIGRIYLLLLKFQKYTFFNKISSKILRFQIEREKEWATYAPILDDAQALFNIHIGSFQSHHYVSEEFRTKLSAVINKISPARMYDIKEDDVAIHIRRGDFITFAGGHIYNIIPIAYYLEALGIIQTRISINKVYIFSDDLDAIKDEIEQIRRSFNVILVNEQSVLQDMNLLRFFSFYILGNSTFAWWGAMLSTKERPTVFVPKDPWKVEMPGASPYLPEWIQLPNV